MISLYTAYYVTILYIAKDDTTTANDDTTAATYDTIIIYSKH